MIILMYMVLTTTVLWIAGNVYVGIQFLCTFGAEAMAELGIGSVLNIMLDLLPVALVIPDVFAVRANGNEALKGSYLSQSFFKLFDNGILFRLRLF